MKTESSELGSCVTNSTCPQHGLLISCEIAQLPFLKQSQVRRKATTSRPPAKIELMKTLLSVCAIQVIKARLYHRLN